VQTCNRWEAANGTPIVGFDANTLPNTHMAKQRHGSPAPPVTACRDVYVHKEEFLQQYVRRLEAASGRMIGTACVATFGIALSTFAR
jgi:hypothetical protein